MICSMRFFGGLRPIDLSAKEAELAMLLLTGCSLQEAAERRAVRITTLRSQLASLFRKTGTARQGQLVALLARLCCAPIGVIDTIGEQGLAVALRGIGVVRYCLSTCTPHAWPRGLTKCR